LDGWEARLNVVGLGQVRGRLPDQAKLFQPIEADGVKSFIFMGHAQYPKEADG